MPQSSRMMVTFRDWSCQRARSGLTAPDALETAVARPVARSHVRASLCAGARTLDPRILLHRRARAHEVAIAIGIVHPSDRRPELPLAHPLQRERRALARV